MPTQLVRVIVISDCLCSSRPNEIYSQHRVVVSDQFEVGSGIWWDDIGVYIADVEKRVAADIGGIFRKTR